MVTPKGSALLLPPPPSSRLDQRSRAKRPDGMAALTQTPVLPEPRAVGALSAQLRRPRPWSAMSASRRARELLCEAFFDEKHPEASARRLSNERPSLFAPFEMKCTVTLINFRRNIHMPVGDCQRPVFARIRTQFIDRHNKGKRCSWINSYRRGLDSELLPTRCFKRFNRRFQQFRQHCARPARPQKQVMNPTQCPQPRRDRLASVRHINGGAQTLVGYRLHDTQGVF